MRPIDYFDRGTDRYPERLRSPVGEVLKKDLRAAYWAGRERKI